MTKEPGKNPWAPTWAAEDVKPASVGRGRGRRRGRWRRQTIALWSSAESGWPVASVSLETMTSCPAAERVTELPQRSGGARPEGPQPAPGATLDSLTALLRATRCLKRRAARCADHEPPRPPQGSHSKFDHTATSILIWSEKPQRMLRRC